MLVRQIYLARYTFKREWELSRRRCVFWGKVRNTHSRETAGHLENEKLWVKARTIQRILWAIFRGRASNSLVWDINIYGGTVATGGIRSEVRAELHNFA